jgi:hypothetical protein
MEKRELKHLSAYYPYNVICKRGKNKPRVLHAITPWLKLDGLKLILRPLSDLTKEIEVNGDKFIPKERLYKKWLEIHKATYGDKSESLTRGTFDIFINVVYEPKGYDRIEHWMFQDLIKWHFDVFSLIDNGSALDINTL